jgi:UDP-glucose 4-epimerase
MKKLLITGGLGFIGSWLVDTLLEDPEVKIFIVDNCSSNAVDSTRWKSRKRVSVIATDISDISAWSGEKYDTVFHLASYVGPVGILPHAGRMGLGIINDTTALIDYCLLNSAKLINVSTSEIYGASGMFPEDSEKIFPKEYEIRTEYGAGKMLAEMAICNTAKVKELRYHTIRPFNVAGPRQKPEGGFVLPRFVIAALTNQPIPIYGDGTQMRAFTDVRDICSAIVDIELSSTCNEMWNIGNIANCMTIKDLALLVKSEIESRSSTHAVYLDYVDPREIHGDKFSDVENKLPDANKIRKKLSWEPRVRIGKTIADVVNFYSDRLAEGYTFNVWTK